MKEVTRVAAYGLVTNDQEILLCRFSDALPQYKGQWTLPGGGVEFGENPIDAVTREVREETGLIVNPTGLAGIDSFTTRGDQQSFHAIRILYHTEVISGQLAFEIGGTTDMCKWFTYKETQQLEIVDLVKVGLGHAFES